MYHEKNLSSGFLTWSDTNRAGCTATEDGWRLDILDLGSRRIVLSM